MKDKRKDILLVVLVNFTLSISNITLILPLILLIYPSFKSESGTLMNLEYKLTYYNVILLQLAK